MKRGAGLLAADIPDARGIKPQFDFNTDGSVVSLKTAGEEKAPRTYCKRDANKDQDFIQL